MPLLAKIGFDTAESEPWKMCPLSEDRRDRLPLARRAALPSREKAAGGGQPRDDVGRAPQRGVLPAPRVDHRHLRSLMLFFHVLEIVAKLNFATNSSKLKIEMQTLLDVIKIHV